MKVHSTLLAGALCALATAGITAHTLSAQAAAPKHIQVTAHRFGYSPGEITLKEGQPVVLDLTTTDVEHGLRFKDLNLNATIVKGKPSELTFTPTKTGTFIGHCSVFCGSGHGSMILTIHVVQ